MNSKNVERIEIIRSNCGVYGLNVSMYLRVCVQPMMMRFQEDYVKLIFKLSGYASLANLQNFLSRITFKTPLPE